jgi:hypothetical protein
MTVTWLVFVQFRSSALCYLYYFSLATQSLLCLAYATKIEMLGTDLKSAIYRTELWVKIRYIPDRHMGKLPGACDSAGAN